MKVTELVGRHIDSCREFETFDFRCAMCGRESHEGVRNAFSDAFNDFNYLQSTGNSLCRYCAAVMGHIRTEKGSAFFRCFSFVCTEDKLAILKREDILEHLLSPPDGLFVICITYSNKKHMAFKAKLQCNRERYTVTTDRGDAVISMPDVRKILPVCRAWYSVIPEKSNTKQQPTWFTKDDILHGCTNAKRISDYGVKQYMTENMIIEPYRNTDMLKLLAFALNKGIS